MNKQYYNSKINNITIIIKPIKSIFLPARQQIQSNNLIKTAYAYIINNINKPKSRQKILLISV